MTPLRTGLNPSPISRLYQAPALSYVSRSMRAEWAPKADYRLRGMTPADIALAQRVLQRCFRIVHSMQLAGVGILAGSDTPFPFCVPGFSLHDELELLVEAGLSPLEALQAATIRPAEFLGRERSLGSVEQGKAADLVLLDGDPLQDIRNTRKIAAVVVNGVYLPRAGFSTACWLGYGSRQRTGEIGRATMLACASMSAGTAHGTARRGRCATRSHLLCCTKCCGISS